MNLIKLRATLYHTQADNPKVILMTTTSNAPSPLAQKAHKCYQQGDFVKSIALFKEALAEEPHSSILHQALGNVYKAAGQLPDALQHYQESLKYNPHDWSCYYHIGLLYNKINEPTQAIAMFKRALDRAPGRIEVQSQLAQTYALNDDLENAIAHYECVLQQKLEHPGALFNIGLLLSKRSRYSQALPYLEKAQTYYPEDPELFFHLGLCSQHTQQNEVARNYYRHTLTLAPQHGGANHNLGCLYLQIKEEALALKHLQASLAVMPHNVTAQYLVHALTQTNTPTEAPREYLRCLFNEYAANYETHLFGTLKSQGPNEIRRMMGPIKARHLEPWRALDLGCGTGVCARYFHDIVDRLEGVDIAEEMIYIAKTTNAYEKLYTEDYMLTLAKNLGYHFIFGIDTVIYVGDLRNLFKSVYGALAKEGYFAFTVEEAPAEVNFYRLNKTGRYQHNKDAIIALAESLDFKLIACDHIPLREQFGEWCMGFGMVFQKNG